MATPAERSRGLRLPEDVSDRQQSYIGSVRSVQRQRGVSFSILLKEFLVPHHCCVNRGNGSAKTCARDRTEGTPAMFQVPRSTLTTLLLEYVTTLVYRLQAGRGLCTSYKVT